MVFKAGSECKFYISGPVEEVCQFVAVVSLIGFVCYYCSLLCYLPLQNELVLVGVLDVIYDTVSTLLRQQVMVNTPIELSFNL